MAAPKEGLRKQLNSLASDIGPTIHDIRAVIAYFSKGKALIGYHMPLKLQDLGLLPLVALPQVVLQQKLDFESQSNLQRNIIASKFE